MTSSTPKIFAIRNLPSNPHISQFRTAAEMWLLQDSIFAECFNYRYSLILIFIIMIRTSVVHQYFPWRVSPHAVMITTPAETAPPCLGLIERALCAGDDSVTVVQPHSWSWTIRASGAGVKAQNIQCTLALHLLHHPL